ncbi:MAG: hypothetical protein K2N23_05825 [Clostridia bacterium]|nr:hypothetical protein [Clostridia bacterium]
MEKENQNKHRCNICKFYDPFYIKKETCFEKLKDGYCNMCKQLKNHKETCEQWINKSYWLLSRKKTTERVLKDILFHLMAVAQILREEEYEKNKNK